MVSDDKLIFVSLTPRHIWEESLACLIKKIITSLPFVYLSGGVFSVYVQ